MDCAYHNKLYKLQNAILGKIMFCNIPWDVIKFWFGDESYFDTIYENVFSEILGTV